MAIYGCGCKQVEKKQVCRLHQLPLVHKEKKCYTCGEWYSYGHTNYTSHITTLSHLQDTNDRVAVQSAVRGKMEEGET